MEKDVFLLLTTEEESEELPKLKNSDLLKVKKNNKNAEKKKKIKILEIYLKFKV
jgi:hypothetical protein